MCGSELTPKPQGLTASDKRLLAQAQRVLSDELAVTPSPCVSVCRMSDDTQLCAGCWRSLEEIAGWASRSVADKRAVWGQIQSRLHAHTKGTA
jgi:predicted Fe-S protein YdhL (DUF1289 family)